MTKALRTATVFHYAGHALTDNRRPERSYLLLAGVGNDGRLTASSIAELTLHQLRVAVLSACETERADASGANGLNGIAGAFLAAGAGGVVGSLWRVDDRLTQPLMIAYHHAIQVSANSSIALQRAQLAMLKSPEAALRSPAAWGGFRYLGH